MDKAQVLAHHLAATFQPNESLNTDEPGILRSEGESLSLITPKQISRMIKKKLDPRKAPGHDGITARMLQQLPRKGIVFLTYIYNAILRLGYFPKAWKTAKVIVMPKPGKPLEGAASYRPISLLSTLSKLFEKIFTVRLLPTLHERKVINPRSSVRIPRETFHYRTDSSGQ